MNANGRYTNLSSASPPAAANDRGGGRSLQLTNTKETNAWEGLAIGAVTLARTVSAGSHRLRDRTRREVDGGGGSLPSALRRAFSTRRHRPAAAPGKADGYYWRIHDMGGDDDGDDEKPEAAAGKKMEQREEGEVKKKKKMRRGNSILQACKKLFLA